MGLEILYGDFRCVPAVAAWGDEFHCHLVFILDNCFHCVRYFVVKDVFLWHNPCVLQACHQHSICSGKFVVVSAIDGFDQDRLLSISTMTMMYLLPRWDRVGNLPVWSENTVSHMSYTCVNTSRTFLPVSCDVLGSSRGDCAGCSHVVGLALVDRTFFRV